MADSKCKKFGILLCKQKLLVGHWYKLTEAKMDVKFEYNLPLKMKQTFTVTDGKFQQCEKDTEVTEKILDPLIKSIKESLMNIIGYNRGIWNETPIECPKSHFKSFTELKEHNIPASHVSILGNVTEKGIINNNLAISVLFENKKFSVIKWKCGLNPTQREKYNKKLQFIPNGGPVIISQTDFQALGQQKRYFNIREKTFMITRVAPELQQLLIHGRTANDTVSGMDFLWLKIDKESLMMIEDHTIYPNIIKKQFNSIQAAAEYTDKTHRPSIAIVPGSTMIGNTHCESIWRYSCKQCINYEDALRAHCQRCQSPVEPYIQAKIVCTFRGTKEIKLSLKIDALKTIFKICEDAKVDDNDLRNVTQQIARVCHPGNNPSYTSNDAHHMEPLCYAFIKLARKQNIMFQVLVSSSQGSDGKFYINYRLNDAWCQQSKTNDAPSKIKTPMSNPLKNNKLVKNKKKIQNHTQQSQNAENTSMQCDDPLQPPRKKMRLN